MNTPPHDDDAAVGWLLSTLGQARFPPIAEAWRAVVPPLMLRAAQPDERARQSLEAALQLAACHTSPVVRRLAVASELASVRACGASIARLDDGDALAHALRTFCRFYAATSTALAATTELRADLSGLCDDDGLAAECAAALAAMSACRPARFAIELLRALLRSCLLGGSRLLATLELGGSQVAAAQSSDGAGAAAVAAERAASTCLAPVPHSAGVLVASLACLLLSAHSSVRGALGRDECVSLLRISRETDEVASRLASRQRGLPESPLSARFVLTRDVSRFALEQMAAAPPDDAPAARGTLAAEFAGLPLQHVPSATVLQRLFPCHWPAGVRRKLHDTAVWAAGLLPQLGGRWSDSIYCGGLLSVLLQLDASAVAGLHWDEHAKRVPWHAAVEAAVGMLRMALQLATALQPGDDAGAGARRRLLACRVLAPTIEFIVHAHLPSVCSDALQGARAAYAAQLLSLLQDALQEAQTALDSHDEFSSIAVLGLLSTQLTALQSAAAAMFAVACERVVAGGGAMQQCDVALLWAAVSIAHERINPALVPPLMALCVTTPAALLGTLELAARLLARFPEESRTHAPQLTASFLALDTSAAAHAVESSVRRQLSSSSPTSEAESGRCHALMGGPLFSCLCDVATLLLAHDSSVSEQQHASAVTAVLLAVARAMPGSTARVHAFSVLGHRLFACSHGSIQRGVATTVGAAHARAALDALSIVSPDAEGRLAGGSDTLLTAFAASALATIDAHHHRARCCCSIEAGSMSSCAAGDSPGLRAFLCAVALAGEAAVPDGCYAHASASSHDRVTLAGGATIAASDTRAWAASVLRRLLRASSARGGASAMALVLQQHCMRPAMLRRATPGSPLLVKQMRAWQLLAALACSLPPPTAPTPACSSLPSDESGVPPAPCAAADDVASALAVACMANLAGVVRQYIEVATGVLLARLAAVTLAVPACPLSELVHALALRAAAGDLAPSAAEDTGPPLPLIPGSRVQLGWSNAALVCTAVTIALERAAARASLTVDPRPRALAQSAAAFAAALATLCAVTQRRAVREALQCCLLRVGSLLDALQPAPPVAAASLSSPSPLLLLDTVLHSLRSDAEVARMLAHQPALLQPAAAALAPDVALLYALLPMDHNIPASEAASLETMRQRAVRGDDEAVSPQHLALQALIAARMAASAVAATAAGSVAHECDVGDGTSTRSQGLQHPHDCGLGDVDEDGLSDASALQRAAAVLRALQRQLSGGTQQPPASTRPHAGPLFHAKAGAEPRSPHPALHAGRLTLVASLVRKPGNIGSLLRSAEALALPGCLTVVLGQPLGALLAHPDVVRMACGAGRRLDALGALKLVDPRSLPAFLGAAARTERTTVLAAELTQHSVPLPCVRFFPAPGGSGDPWHTVVLLGHEVDGVPASLLATASACVAVPQHGATASLNVAAAAGMIVYEYARQQQRG